MKAKTLKISTLLSIASWLSALEAILAVGYLLTIPSDPKNAFLFGLSTQRLALALLFILLFIVCAVAGWLIRKYSESLSSRFAQFFDKRLINVLIITMIPIILLGWVFTFLPSYRMGVFNAYFERLQPLIIWLMLASIQVLACIFVWRWGLRSDILLERWRSSRTLLIVAASSLLFCVMVWLLIVFTGVGLIPDSAHWNEVGVPVLGIQVIASIVLGLVFYISYAYFEKTHDPFQRFFSSKSWALDISIGFLIWAVAALLWNIVSQEKSFFAPGPYPPNQVFYPYSDAALYDTSAQLALIGEGLNAGGYVDKPLYSAFLVLLNLIAGENFNLVVIFQVMVLALLPVTAYYLGKSFHSRGLGISLAMMIIFKQYNAIRSTVWVSTSTSRILMSEVPTALFIAIFTLWVFEWLKNRGKKPWQAMIAGGVLGLSTMVRHNVWLLLPTAILMAWMAFGIKRFRKWLLNCSLLILVLFMSIVPWSWRLIKNGGSPLNVLTPLIGTIWRNRYLPSIDTPQAYPTDLFQTSESIISPSEELSFPVFESSEPAVTGLLSESSEPVITGLFSESSEPLVTGSSYESSEPVTTGLLPESSEPLGTGQLPEASEPVIAGQLPEASESILLNDQSPGYFPESSESSSPESASEIGTLQESSTSASSQETAIDRVEQFIISHFFHNLITSVLELPHFFLFHDIETLMTMEGSHWDEDWLGKLLPGCWLLMGVNLVLISLGIGAAYKQWSVAGLLPLSIYFGYLAANAIARTSGGRYLVPFDWILFLYFAAGCFQIVFWVLSLFGFDLELKTFSPSQTSRISFKTYVFISISFLCIGMLIPLTESIKADLYNASFDETVATMIVQGDMEKLGINAGDLDTFFSSPSAVLVEGRALYPRFYYGDQGEPGSAAALRSFVFPRFVFRMISPAYSGYVMLPASISPDPFPHTSDVVVVGCVSDGGWIDAYAVILKGETDTVYLRDPAAEFACPLPVPICNDNHVCH